jgi:hypothetical protein
MKTGEFRRALRRGGAALLAGAALAGCGVTASHDGDRLAQSLEQCIDAPLPYHAQDPKTLGVLVLAAGTDHTLVSEPPADPVRRALQAQASVEIRVGNYAGSGIVTTDPQNRQIILTHVVAGAARPEDITIMAANGTHHSTPAADACGVSQENGKLVGPKHTSSTTDEIIDLAIITPETPLDVKPLPRATSNAPRGSWLDLVGYGGDSTVDQPHIYGGVAITDHMALTGVQGYRHVNGEPIDAYNAEPGYSGSGLVDPNLGIRGILFAGSPHMYTNDQLINDQNVILTNEFNGETGMTPSATMMTPINTVNELLASTTRYYDQAPQPSSSPS